MNDRGLVFALLLTVVACGQDKAKIATARVSACTVRSAAELEMVDTAKCATTVAELVRDKRLDKDQPDPWGQAFTIKCEPDIVVTSSGPDKTMGTADDVTGDAKTCQR